MESSLLRQLPLELTCKVVGALPDINDRWAVSLTCHSFNTAVHPFLFSELKVRSITLVLSQSKSKLQQPEQM